MTMKEIEKLDMKEIRKLADKEYSIHEAKMGSLFVAASFKNPADKIKWDFTEGFIAGAKSQIMSEWVSVEDRLPEVGVEVLVLETKTNKYCPNIFMGSFEPNGKENVWWKDERVYNSAGYYVIIAWRLLPSLPPPPQTSK